MIEVFSSGGGTQSAAIAALIVQGRLPKPDFVVIADTDYECSSTWTRVCLAQATIAAVVYVSSDGVS
jgi:hypothetical protein